MFTLLIRAFRALCRTRHEEILTVRQFIDDQLKDCTLVSIGGTYGHLRLIDPRRDDELYHQVKLPYPPEFGRARLSSGSLIFRRIYRPEDKGTWCWEIYVVVHEIRVCVFAPDEWNERSCTRSIGFMLLDQSTGDVRKAQDFQIPNNISGALLEELQRIGE